MAGNVNSPRQIREPEHLADGIEIIQREARHAGNVVGNNLLHNAPEKRQRFGFLKGERKDARSEEVVIEL
jgi:hypothetical protein